MNDYILKNKQENVDKLKIGFCVEVDCLINCINSDISLLKQVISDNKFLFNEHDLPIIDELLRCLSDNSFNCGGVISSYVDKEETYCNYCSKYY